MRFPRLSALVLLAFTNVSIAQTGIWSHVSPSGGSQHLQAAKLTKPQLDSVATLLRHRKAAWECEGPDSTEMINGLRFESLPVPGKQDVFLAEAPAGCARGGQGANGAMWVIHFNGAQPTLLATPDQFSGWLFSVQPTASHGYPDIVLGWHMSAAEAGLSYMRFDGKLYHRIGAASLVNDDNGNERIESKPKSRAD